MQRLIYSLILALTAVLSGCGGARTEQLIDYIDPEGMVIVSKEEGDAAIKHLARADYVVLSNGNYLIHKSRIRSVGDYTVIAAAAPITITIDSAMYVIEGMARLLVLPGQGASRGPDTITIPILLFK